MHEAAEEWVQKHLCTIVAMETHTDLCIFQSDNGITFFSVIGGKQKKHMCLPNKRFLQFKDDEYILVVQLLVYNTQL